MTPLQSRALARDVLPAAEVERVYENLRGRGFVGDLCESHERLRAELEGATVLLDRATALLAEREAEIARLREQIAGHCERIAKQSELLSRKAEARPCPKCLVLDGAELVGMTPAELAARFNAFEPSTGVPRG